MDKFIPSIQAFPQPLYYNRLTGSFQEVEDDAPYGGVLDATDRDPRRGMYGPGDAERERIMDWAKRERLPLFLRYKNCTGNFKNNTVHV